MGKVAARLIDVLKSSRYGMSIQKIADTTKWHRNTVRKYLNILEEEGKVVNRNIGQYKLYVLVEAKDEVVSGQDRLLADAYRLFLGTIHKLHPELDDWKEIGTIIGNEINIEEYFPAIDFRNFLTLPLNLAVAAKLLMDLLNNIYFFTYEKYNFDPPLINHSPPFIVLRISESRHASTPAHFEMIAGILEARINLTFNIGVEVDIQKIHLKENVIDIKISFTDLEIIEKAG